jgi:hypothetical protein
MFKKIMIPVFICASIVAIGHEGHDKVPGAMKAHYGGVVISGDEINLEYVVSGAEVKLFPLSHEGQNINPKDVKLTVTTKLPKGKPEVIKTEILEKAFVAKVDFKKSYRVEMSVEAEVSGIKSQFKFQVEK